MRRKVCSSNKGKRGRSAQKLKPRPKRCWNDGCGSEGGRESTELRAPIRRIWLEGRQLHSMMTDCSRVPRVQAAGPFRPSGRAAEVVLEDSAEPLPASDRPVGPADIRNREGHPPSAVLSSPFTKAHGIAMTLLGTAPNSPPVCQPKSGRVRVSDAPGPPPLLRLEPVLPPQGQLPREVQENAPRVRVPDVSGHPDWARTEKWLAFGDVDGEPRKLAASRLVPNPAARLILGAPQAAWNGRVAGFSGGVELVGQAGSTRL